MIHCLFEQSGTFKRAAMRLGYEAKDYDILNDFGETDMQIDLFREIRRAFNHEKSIFDTFTKDDIIFAFFPCTKFSIQLSLHFRGKTPQSRKKSPQESILNAIRLEKERCEYYELFSQLFLIAMERGLQVIVENPFTYGHYLNNYFPILPSVVDRDRTLLGDKMQKPTQYWFINLEPKNNFFLESTIFPGKPTGIVHHNLSRVERSLISPEYAYNFIRIFIGENNK